MHQVLVLCFRSDAAHYIVLLPFLSTGHVSMVHFNCALGNNYFWENGKKVGSISLK